jgi:predicted GTPase
MGKKPVAIRHPMPYGDLEKQAVQRFASIEDIDNANCTVEEREEYEPIVRLGFTVYAGVDYYRILNQASAEGDVIVWDGGNNDLPFIKSDLEIVVIDARRFHHSWLYHPGETNLRRADIVIINKVDRDESVNDHPDISDLNSKAKIILTSSPVKISPPLDAKGKTVVVIEDGPTVTHGGMDYGAGYIAARECGATIIRPHFYAVGSIKETLDANPHLHFVVPAMGYSKEQLKDLEETLARMPVGTIVSATPTDIGRLIKTNKKIHKVSYSIEEVAGETTIKTELKNFFGRRKK